MVFGATIRIKPGTGDAARRRTRSGRWVYGLPADMHHALWTPSRDKLERRRVRSRIAHRARILAPRANGIYTVTAIGDMNTPCAIASPATTLDQPLATVTSSARIAAIVTRNARIAALGNTIQPVEPGFMSSLNPRSKLSELDALAPWRVARARAVASLPEEERAAVGPDHEISVLLTRGPTPAESGVWFIKGDGSHRRPGSRS
jgi:hypothetical protein